MVKTTKAELPTEVLSFIILIFCNGIFMDNVTKKLYTLK